MEQKIEHFGIITPDLRTFHFWKDQNVKKESPHKYFPILQENDIYHGDITNVLAINNNGRHNPSEEKLYLIAEDRIKMFEKLDSQK